MDNVASAIVGPVASVLTGHITQKLRNLTSSADRVKEMKDKMKVLDGHRVDNENHLRRNRENNKEIPARVPGWLEEVENIKNEVEKIPSNDIGCFSVKKKYRAGKNALTHIKDIDRLINEKITWTDVDIPLGRVDSKRPPSTSTLGGNTQIVFKSRDKIFDDALKFLQQDDDKTRVIALCGMGGVGKTTLMKQLKEVAHDNNMFKWIVDVAVGKSSNLFAIQNAIAAQTGEPLTESDEKLRAAYLSKRFKGFLELKEKILVILDDVWEKIKVEDIGLESPFRNGVKLLLTSRDENICHQIAVDAGSVLQAVRVDVLEEEEARDFFCQITKISAEHDRDLYEKGCKIVKKCGYLPLAIKLIAATLYSKDEYLWRRTLKRLKKNDLDENLQKIINISYESLVHDDKAIFLLCGLFPEDSNIPIEDLTRYAWGLELLKEDSSMEDARDSTHKSVSNLKNAYLLMNGDSRHSDCVKMHDLVLAFVVGSVSKGGKDGCRIMQHDDFSKLSEANNMSQSCKQLSLTCKGISEFPSEFQFPNLSLLKLMQGDESLRFPQDFYEGKQKLQVIAFEKLEYPPVPTSAQFSTNLRTLCLHECSLMFDLACIRNLSNLEVLSFAKSGITTIPSEFGNLKNLRLLDVTGCYNLVIDDGVFKNLVTLEELYLIPYKRACCFTDSNGCELAECSKNLSALEFKFIGDNAHLKNNMSFRKLERFKLLVGCYFDELKINLVDAQSYQNSLYLVTNRDELLKSKIHELFENTDVLYLRVNDINTLEDVDVESPRPAAPGNFNRLRVLIVSKCAELTYLFTPSVATILSKLEYLEISECPRMEAVCNGSDIIKFPNLKYLRLADLPKLLSFSNNINVIKLPRLMELQLEGLQSLTSIYPDSATSFVPSNMTPTQSFLNAQDATPKLEKLFVKHCDSIEVLFNMDFGEIEQLSSSSLRSIKVDGCNSLVKLFSCNPFPFFNNLQELEVRRCRSIQVLFEIESGRAGRYEEQDATPKLEKLFVSDMENLKEIWPPRFSINNLCPLRELTVKDCGSIEVLFNLDFGEIEQLSSSLRSITVSKCNSLVKLFSCNPFPFLNNLQELEVRRCGSIEVLFNTDFGLAGKSEEQVCSSSLRSIEVSECDTLVKLFSCNPFPFLNNLQDLNVESCGSIEVLFNTDLGRAGKSEEHVCSSTRLRSIEVSGCDSLVNLLPGNPMPLFNHLEELDVRSCASVEVIFDIDMGCVGEMDKVSSSRLRSIDLYGLGKLREVWRIKDAGSNLIHGFEAVESICIRDCERFENLVTPATTNLDMRTLKEVQIKWCGRESGRKNELVESKQDQEIDVVSMPGKESNDNVPKVALPFYLLLTFQHLHNLYLWDYKDVDVVFEITTPSSRESPHNTQQPPILPHLEELWLEDMGKMSHVWKCDWNEYLILQKQPSQCSFHNLTTITMYRCHNIKYLFSPLMVKLLSSLKKIDIGYCHGIEEVVSNRDDIPSCDGTEEVVSARDDEDASIYSHTTTTFFPNLDLLIFWGLTNFKCIGGGINGISSDIHDQLKLTSWSLCQYAREISIEGCDALSSAIPWYAVGQMQKLQVLKIINCKSMTEVFNTGKSLPKLPKLKILKIQGCNLLKHIFTISTLESLKQLEELELKNCKAMEVIVTEENGEQTTASVLVVFPHLKSLELVNLPNFVGVFLGKNEFRWPALEKVVIRECPQITVFTYGQSTAPKLNVINTSLGKHSVECGLNFHVTTTSHQARLPSYESTSSCHPTTMERFPWSFHNLIEMDVNYNPSGGQTLFSSDKLLQLQKLETVHFRGCEDTQEIFDSETVAEIPNLRQVDLQWLSSLKYIWKSKQGTVLKFPNLTRLYIYDCYSLEYVFTCPMVGSLLQLQELHISLCNRMKVIVKGEEEECNAIVNAAVVFPCLKSLKLFWKEEFFNPSLSLRGFCLGEEAFSFPSLDTLEIGWCPKMTVFTKGDLSAPKLYAISSRWGRKYNIHNRLNSVIKDFTKWW